MENLPLSSLESEEIRYALLDIYDINTLVNIYNTGLKYREILNSEDVINFLYGKLDYQSDQVSSFDELSEDGWDQLFDSGEMPNWMRDEQEYYPENNYIDNIEDDFQEWLTNAIINITPNEINNIVSFAKICIDFGFMYTFAEFIHNVHLNRSQDYLPHSWSKRYINKDYFDIYLEIAQYAILKEEIDAIIILEPYVHQITDTDWETKGYGGVIIEMAYPDKYLLKTLLNKFYPGFMEVAFEKAIANDDYKMLQWLFENINWKSSEYEVSILRLQQYALETGANNNIMNILKENKMN